MFRLISEAHLSFRKPPRKSSSPVPDGRPKGDFGIDADARDRPTKSQLDQGSSSSEAKWGERAVSKYFNRLKLARRGRCRAWESGTWLEEEKDSHCPTCLGPAIS